MAVQAEISTKFEELCGDPVMGIDEAGRGPLVGGVYAAAVSCPVAVARELLAGAWSGINDSKKLTERKRFALADVIRGTDGCLWCVASASHAEIDELNILRATHLAMRRAADGLVAKAEASGILRGRRFGILVDGLPVASLPNSQNVIKGDAKSLFIAAASILAKTARDEDCFRLEREYPGYGFAKHKGYPTPSHLEALARLGPCPEHRRSFRPVLGKIVAVTMAVALAFGAVARDFPVPPKWSAVLTRSGAIETKHGHIQGICAANDAVYMTLVNGLYKFDWLGRLVKRVELKPHVGDICLCNDRLYLVTCGSGGNRIEVYDFDLNFVKGTTVSRSADGVTCLDGVLYVGLGPVRDKMRPYRGNYFGKFDAETLEPLCEPFIVDHGEMSWLGVQGMTTDGEHLYVNFYTPVDDIPNFFKFDRNFNVKGSWFLGCGHGVDVVGGARPSAVRFVHSCTIGIFDQRGDDPMPPQTLLRYAELTPDGKMVDVTKYESYVYNRIHAHTTVEDLRVCGKVEPSDVVKPIFSWWLKSDRQGASQKAYAIELRTEDGAEVWRSGRIVSADSCAVKYTGPALKGSTRYIWSVIVTDERGREIFSIPATFTTTNQ